MTQHIYINPNEYSLNNHLQYQFAMEMLKENELDIKAKVLDIGCGDGRVTYEMAKIVKKGTVIGTDISSEMINYASEKYKSQQNLQFITMDATQNNFCNEFNLITSFNCLHWINDQNKALQGIVKAATSGATILLLLSHQKSPYHHALEELCIKPKWNMYFKNTKNPRIFFEKDDYMKLLVNNDLQIIKISEQELFYSFKNEVDFKNFFKSSGSYIKHIPNMMKDDFLADFLRLYTKEYSRVEDNLEISFWCLKINAIKKNK